MDARGIAVQSGVAQVLAGAVSEAWERIVVALEMETTEEGRVMRQQFFHLSAAGDGDFRETSPRELPRPAAEAFVELNDAMLASDGTRWNAST